VPRPACRSPRPVPSALLDRLAEHLLSARRTAEQDGAALVRVGAGHAEDDLDLALLPLPEGVHPVDALVGEVLPTQWWANGVVASARARSVDDPASAEPVVIVVLVDRDGRCVHRLEGPSAVLDPDSPPPTGRVVDLLLRTVGRPTPAPTSPPVRWCDAVWLDRIASTTLAGDVGHRDVEALAGLHPLLPPRSTLDDLAALHREQAADPVGAWRGVRRAASRRGAPDTVTEGELRATVSEHLSPEEVAWLDEGSLARWLEAELPDLADLLGLTDALLPRRLARDLRRAVGEAGPSDPRDQG
jgi:hypothetical protein